MCRHIPTSPTQSIASLLATVVVVGATRIREKQKEKKEARRKESQQFEKELLHDLEDEQTQTEIDLVDKFADGKAQNKAMAGQALESEPLWKAAKDIEPHEQVQTSKAKKSNKKDPDSPRVRWKSAYSKLDDEKRSRTEEITVRLEKESQSATKPPAAKEYTVTGKGRHVKRDSGTAETDPMTDTPKTERNILVMEAEIAKQEEIQDQVENLISGRVAWIEPHQQRNDGDDLRIKALSEIGKAWTMAPTKSCRGSRRAEGRMSGSCHGRKRSEGGCAGRRPQRVETWF
ncbi:uncharacterized protein BDZ99DRAFT_494355 [Mytilinidion resinicola]|uniref:Uncharacterized protein n=1 Tax=Mytilinidion resinicola TaxID=574789 RepID=A0A6A6Z762_9PEZI|nr:uncharacterized protein BDZ99DRAFT_494355 [Mytilinidion resinicola]KAF2816549.1 hypothetical protein BDZ99DRAFT_494355 [Mytilinidion resinicola]